MDLQLLGIGPLELVFFFIILLLLFGPTDLVRMARNVGRFINRVTRSENYQVIQQASRELRNLPERLVKEAQLEDLTQKPQVDRPPSGPAPASPERPFQAWTQELSPPAERPQPPEVSPPPDPGQPSP